MLADELSRFMEKRGGDDELVQKVLGGKGPRELAAQLVVQATVRFVRAESPTCSQRSR